MPPDRPRRLVILSTAHGHGYGAESVLGHLLGSWNKALPITLIAPLDSDAVVTATSLGLSVLPLMTRRDAFTENFRALNRLRPHLHDVGLVHAWHARGFELAAYLGRRLHCVATGTLHDHPKAAFHGRIRRLLMRISANRFAVLVAVSQALAAVCPHAGYRCPIRVIHNGLGDLPPGNRTPHPRTHKCIGFLGMYAPWKGFDVVRPWIEATVNSGWVWNLYGDVAPELSGSASSLAARWPGRVILKGHVDTRDIFTDIDILVHASTEFEPYGMVLTEAGRAGIPAVAADIGGPGEIVRNAETGFLFDPRHPEDGLDRLRQLMAHEHLRADFGAAGRQHFESTFHADQMFRQYTDMWKHSSEQEEAP